VGYRRGGPPTPRNNYIVINNVTMWRRMDGLTYTVTTTRRDRATANVNATTGELTLTRVGFLARPRRRT
jgi:hypothetical protein